MYHWHLREINGRSNLGWHREQLFSVVQQVMRQDIGYYPYYTKNPKAGDRTSLS